MSNFRTPYDSNSLVSSSGVDCSALPSRTKQSFRDECNINRIMAKYEKTGLASWVSANEGRYGDFAAFDFHEAQNFIADANSMFQGLPAEVRYQFDNDPGKFLNFVEDPSNEAKMISMGLKTAPDELAGDGKGVTPTEPVPPV